MNVPVMSTARARQDGPDGARTELGRVRVAVMLPSLLPPLTGESSRLEDRPADLRAVPGQVGFGERDQVILADGPVHPDRPFGDHGAEPCRRSGRCPRAARSGASPPLPPRGWSAAGPARRPGRPRHGHEGGQFGLLQLEEAGREQRPARARRRQAGLRRSGRRSPRRRRCPRPRTPRRSPWPETASAGVAGIDRNSTTGRACGPSSSARRLATLICISASLASIAVR